MNQPNPLQTHTQVQPHQTLSEVQAAASTLIDQVVALMRSRGIPQERIDIMLADNMIARTRTGSLADQRCTLNVFWQLQLGQFNNTTFRERFSLVEAGTEKDWIVLFERYVLNFIVDMQLPVAWK